MKDWRIGLIGAGYFSQYHLQGWTQLPGVQVTAICDGDRSKASALATQFAVPASYDDATEMITNESLDVVDIVAPPAAHEALVRLGISHKRPMICQKPFGSSYAQAMELAQAAAKAGVPLLIHENFRYTPWFRELKRLVGLGHFGALHQVSFRLRTGDGQGPLAYLSRQPYFQTMPRFLVAETAIHFIDVFRYLMGEVTAVYANLRRINPAIAGEDAGVIVFEFASGSIGIFDGNRLNDHPASNPRRTLGELWLEGERGVMRLDGDARLWWKPHQQVEQAHTYNAGSEHQFGGGACAALQADALSALAGEGRYPNHATAYLQNLRIQEAIYSSATEGRRVEIDPAQQPLDALTPLATRH